MGWYSVYKWFSSFSKKEYINRIYWYNNYVLKTPEQREKEDRIRKMKARTCMMCMGVMSSYIEQLKENI